MEERLRELSDGVAEALKEEGLYMEYTVIAKSDGTGRLLQEMPDTEGEMLEDLIDGQTYVLVSHLQVGDRAFLPRMENPEQYEVDKEARKIIPTEADMIKERLEAGEDLFNLEDEDGDPGS